MVAALSSVRGQDRAVGLLLRYLETGRVPHGLLFSGEEGIGKETAALGFAAALFCRSRSGTDACGACPDCRLLRSGSHPNFLRVSPENLSISIDDIRLLQEELSLKSFSDRPRVVLILPADRMTVQAANALLKTLEEPPPATHLLLVAHRISRLPATIVSRCQKVSFVPLPAETVERILAGLPGKGARRPQEEIRWAAACSGGSPGRALAALEEEDGERREWLRLLSSFDPAAVFAKAAAWKGGGDLGPRIAAPLSLVRDAAMISSGGKEGIMNEDLSADLSSLAGRRSAGEWTRAFQELLSMSRTPPQLQKPLMLEAFLFEFFGKD
ncbi:MAG TPA: DNA polymerase III subunit delta' [Deltaproteobacteria bacterium]|nr:MAG: DNA polymerase III subunit delta' [Deltaproteobacteria bacterium GWC2_65_14]HBO70503.1 DNA polymerase III subunit delta' [Deltaproteobacteria bacterium]